MMISDGDENVYKKVIILAFPAMMESFFNAFAGLIDSYMVSRLGPGAVAAIGLCTQPKFVCLSFFMSIGVAVSALVARRRGQEDRINANYIFITSGLILMVVSGLLTAFVLFFSNNIIKLCGSTPDTHADAVTYFSILSMGLIFNGIQLIFNSAQRGIGNTAITMRTNLVSSAVNIIFNYLLIEGHFGFPALGITGAALATVLGTVVAAIMSFLSVLPEKNYVSITYILKEKLLPTMTHFLQIAGLAYSLLLEQLLTRVGFMLTAILAASMGTYPMAAHQVGMNILSISFSLGDGLQAASVALIGYSLGQKKPDMAKIYASCCQKFGILVAVLLGTFYFFSGRTIYMLFFTDEEIVAIGMKLIKVIICLIVFQISQVISFGCLRGAGDTAATAIISVFSCTLVRPVSGYIFGVVLGMGLTGVWLGILSDQICRFLGSYLRMKQGKWLTIRI